MNSHQLWLPPQDLHKVEPVSIPAYYIAVDSDGYSGRRRFSPVISEFQEDSCAPGDVPILVHVCAAHIELSGL